MTAREYARVRYADFSLNLHRVSQRTRVPIHGVIEVTRRCPLACGHCYNNLPMDHEHRHRELSAAELCGLLDEITEAGCLWLLFTGGEVFARNDFLDVYTYAKRKGLLVTLFTNGFLLTDRHADVLAQWRPFSIEITLYGATRRTYERVTRTPGSFEACMRAIRLLLDRRLPLKIKSLVTTQNRHELKAMQRFVEDDLGLEYRFDAVLNPRLNGSKDPLSLRLTPEEVVALDRSDAKRMAALRTVAHEECARSSADGAAGTVYECGAGLISFAVDPYGRLSPCALATADSYDLRAGNFHEGWSCFLREVRRRPRSRPSMCSICRLKTICETCPAHSQLEVGDPEAPVAFHCQVAHLRAGALMVPHQEQAYEEIRCNA